MADFVLPVAILAFFLVMAMMMMGDDDQAAREPAALCPPCICNDAAPCPGAGDGFDEVTK